MQYKNLQELIYNSTSSRKFFLNLPPSTQMNIHKFNEYIHCANDLRLYKEKTDKYRKQVALSEEPLFKNYIS